MFVKCARCCVYRNEIIVVTFRKIAILIISLKTRLMNRTLSLDKNEKNYIFPHM